MCFSAIHIYYYYYCYYYLVFIFVSSCLLECAAVIEFFSLECVVCFLSCGSLLLCCSCFWFQYESTPEIMYPLYRAIMNTTNHGYGIYASQTVPQ
jgi:hypothetical protein